MFIEEKVFNLDLKDKGAVVMGRLRKRVLEFGDPDTEVQYLPPRVESLVFKVARRLLVEDLRASSSN